MKSIRSETVRNETLTLLYSTVNKLFLQDLKSLSMTISMTMTMTKSMTMTMTMTDYDYDCE